MLKKLIALTALAGAALLPAANATAQFDPNYPPPGTPGVYRWYSSFDHMEEVGYRIVECDGTIRGPYGTKTLHQTFEAFTC